MTFFHALNTCMTAIGWITSAGILMSSAILIGIGTRDLRAEKRAAADRLAAEARQAAAWQETLKSEPVNPHALTQLLPLVETPTAPYAVVADRWPTGGGHL